MRPYGLTRRDNRPQSRRAARKYKVQPMNGNRTTVVGSNSPPRAEKVRSRKRARQDERDELRGVDPDLLRAQERRDSHHFYMLDAANTPEPEHHYDADILCTACRGEAYASPGTPCSKCKYGREAWGMGHDAGEAMVDYAPDAYYDDDDGFDYRSASDHDTGPLGDWS